MAQTLDYRLKELEGLGYNSAQVQGKCIKDSIEATLNNYENMRSSVLSKEERLKDDLDKYKNSLDSQKERYDRVKAIEDNGEKPRFWDRVFMKGYSRLERRVKKAQEAYDSQKSKADEYRTMIESVKGITQGINDWNSLEDAIEKQKNEYLSKLNPKYKKYRGVGGTVGGIAGGIAGFIAGAFFGPITPFILASAGAAMGYVAGEANAQTPESLVEREKLKILKSIRSIYDGKLQNVYNSAYYGKDIPGLTKTPPKDAKPLETDKTEAKPPVYPTATISDAEE